MSRLQHAPLHRSVVSVAALAGLLALTACSSGGGEATGAPPAPLASTAAPSTEASSAATGSPDRHGGDHSEDLGGPAAAAGLPSAHVHGVAVNPADQLVYLATHDGLFRYDGAGPGGGGPSRVGPVIDLMGFTVAGPDHFYASGHPGPGTDLPEPVGLIESRDGEATWAALSRQGESDFHALAAGETAVIGYDGTLRRSTDGTAWTTLEPPVEPYALATSPDGATVLATHQAGPIRSTDAGATWTQIENVPLLQVVDWAGDDVVVGVTPDGVTALSTDAGATWTEGASAGGPPQAVGAHRATSGQLRVLVVTQDSVQESTDAGQSFAALPS